MILSDLEKLEKEAPSDEFLFEVTKALPSLIAALREARHVIGSHEGMCEMSQAWLTRHAALWEEK